MLAADSGRAGGAPAPFRGRRMQRDRNGFEIHFPRRLTLALKFLSALPYWASLPLTGRLVR